MKNEFFVRAQPRVTLLEEAQKELVDLRFKAATRQLKSPKDIGKLKKEIARLNTVKRERELGIEQTNGNQS